MSGKLRKLQLRGSQFTASDEIHGDVGIFAYMSSDQNPGWLGYIGD